MSKIHLIRHGQSEFNAAYTGNGDVMIFDAPLTERGHTQAKATRHRVADLGIETVICSPLTRAIQTARHIFPSTAMHVHPETREHLAHSCDVGVPPAQLQATFPDMEFDHLPEVWWHQGPLNALGIPVEPWDVFDARIARLKAELHAWKGRPLAVVCHGHVIRGLTGITPDNCDIVELEA
ncbi:broad specificity phosphatase PhoE [Litoreibacter ponti]|uniref:Broad specificity phosphatase PhoE n=1 Tax=Litoreibacter ponti TaxID=1510457 RepID=A0A2T6BIT3_9RHOB|nr:histidine phosphatase family protein [Litoreibacter ponti]PTX55971.1 broad specificity phosphatase PhoE [Litoreibacter ponti]